MVGRHAAGRSGGGLRLSGLGLTALVVAVLLILPAGEILADPAPAAPTIGSVTPGDEQLTVAFTAPAGVCPPCTVVVEAATSTDFAVIAATASSTTSPVVLTGLTNGTEYRVRAFVRVMSGGAISEFVGDGIIGGAGTRYRVHTFTTVGVTTLTVDRAVDVELLVVGGGGAGGGSAGGGGGAGGMVEKSVTLAQGASDVTVGSGGVSSFTNGSGLDGSSSSLAGQIALGGGGGMPMPNVFPGPAGRSGGSGGGGTRTTNVGNADTAGTSGGAGLQSASATGGHGAAGGPGLGHSGIDTQGGGGGGASAAGATPTSGSPGADGGAGRTSTITGASVAYAGGGGGGVGSAYIRAGAGGDGGGGEGGVTSGGGVVGIGSAGTAGRGGGGGGGSAKDGSGALGGAGGSGIVVVRHVLQAAVHPVAVVPRVPDVDSGVTVDSASVLSVACEPSAPSVGGRLSCTVSGGDPGVDILWRVRVGAQVLEGVVRPGEDGAGAFGVTIPKGTVGTLVSVELVAWLAPLEVGVVRGVVPTSVPAGSGPDPRAERPLVRGSAVLLVSAFLLAAVSGRSRRSPGRLRWSG
jgi:hypothetical protein